MEVLLGLARADGKAPSPLGLGIQIDRRMCCAHKACWEAGEGRGGEGEVVLAGRAPV